MKNFCRGRDDRAEAHIVPRRRSWESLWPETVCEHATVAPEPCTTVYAQRRIGIWVATLGGHAVALVNDGKLLRSINAALHSLLLAVLIARTTLLYCVTVADTAGQPLIWTGCF